MNRIVWVFSLLLIGFTVQITVAQEALVETFTSEDGSLSFNYPDGWIVVEENGTIIGGNSLALVESFQGDAVVSSPDEVGFVIFIGSFAALGLPNTADPAGVLSVVGVDAASSNLQQTEVHGVELTFTEVELQGSRRFIAVRLIDADHVGLFLGLAHPDSLSAFQTTFLAIFASAVYSPPPPPTGIVLDILADQIPVPSVGSDGIVWALNLDETGSYYDKMAVNSSGTIFLTVPVDAYVEIPEELDGGSGFFGLLELDANGVIQRTFYLEETDFESGSNLALANDGSFWHVTIDFEGSDLAHFAYDGSLLSSLRIVDGYAGEARIFIAVDAENNAYVDFDDEVSIWGADGAYVNTFYYSGDLLAASPDGRLYFYVRGESPRITSTDLEGNPLEFAITLSQDLTYATATAVSEDFFYVAGVYGMGPTIYQYDNTGTLISNYTLSDATETTRVSDLAALPNGDLVVAYGNQVIRVQPSVFETGN
ncbi:MAG: hypothetical protein L6Q98_19725 [Anaerolineae bacterium]|nr:hypothetical protein [Anaerolineae bacterium]NUQ04680.1 hypothetical protein [Anaerolineae bacterium]